MCEPFASIARALPDLSWCVPRGDVDGAMRAIAATHSAGLARTERHAMVASVAAPFRAAAVVPNFISVFVDGPRLAPAAAIDVAPVVRSR